MKTIAIINQKGGVGKTSIALSLGKGLMLLGNRVLFVDLDPQGNLSYNMKANTSNYSALRVLQRPDTIEEELQSTEQGDILASTPALTGADATLKEIGKEFKLKEALEIVKNKYDYVVIDTPPALGILTVNALTASTGIVIPAQADIYSLQGIGQLSQTIETVRKYTNPTLKVYGIVLNRYNSRTVLTQQLTDMIEETAKRLNTKLYNTRIREAIAVKESQAMQLDIFTHDPKSKVSKDYNELIKEITDDI